MKAEQFILNHTRNCSNIEYRQGVYAPTYQPWLTPDQALSAVKIAREEMVKKACEWLKENASNYASTAAYSTVVNYDEEFLVEDLKEYINNIDNINNKQNAK